MAPKTSLRLTPSHPLDRPKPGVLALRTAFQAFGHVAPGATARVAEAVFVRTARPAPRAEEIAFLDRASRFAVRAAGQRIACYRWGDPAHPAVLFAHGWWSHAGRFAPLATALLDAGFRGVAFDAPGHGRSTGWRASMPEFAAALRAVGDAEGALHGVVGHSLGGSAAIYATAHGLGAGRIVTIAAPSQLLAWAHRYRDMFSIPSRAFARMQRNMERRLQLSWDELNIATHAASLGVPGMVIHDVDDPDVSFADARAIAAGWPGADLVTTEGLGHRAVLRDPDVIARVVAFMKR
ncbi:MAG: alpha/beta fold hydrolase [Gemmatimonadales bacterium]